MNPAPRMFRGPAPHPNQGQYGGQPQAFHKQPSPMRGMPVMNGSTVDGSMYRPPLPGGPQHPPVNTQQITNQVQDMNISGQQKNAAAGQMLQNGPGMNGLPLPSSSGPVRMMPAYGGSDKVSMNQRQSSQSPISHSAPALHQHSQGGIMRPPASGVRPPPQQMSQNVSRSPVPPGTRDAHLSQHMMRSPVPPGARDPNMLQQSMRSPVPLGSSDPNAPQINDFSQQSQIQSGIKPPGPLPSGLPQTSSFAQSSPSGFQNSIQGPPGRPMSNSVPASGLPPPNSMQGTPRFGPPTSAQGPPGMGPPNSMYPSPGMSQSYLPQGMHGMAPPLIQTSSGMAPQMNPMQTSSRTAPPTSQMMPPAASYNQRLPTGVMPLPMQTSSGVASMPQNQGLAGNLPLPNMNQGPSGMPGPPGMMQGSPNMGPPTSIPSNQNVALMPPGGGFSDPRGMPISSQAQYPQPPNMGMHNMGMQPVQSRPQPGYGGMPQAAQQPARRLDPDQMPSPIQVMEDDRKTKTGFFYTNQKGQLPPLVTTKFTVQDQGNCSPRFIRSTIYNVPSNPDMLKQTAVPFGVSVSPFANVEEGERQLPIVDMGEIGPVRCKRCKAYMCPFMQFIDGGRRFQCIFCKCTTEVPAEYFSHLDHTGLRTDKYQRSELHLGSYELTATLDYCKNSKAPNEPAFIFLLDVSYNSVKSGVVNLLCQNMKTILKSLPKDDNGESKVKVGFITYSSVIHFYNVKECLAQPQMLVVPDVQEMFMPLLDGFLVNAQDSEAVIDSLMEQIPMMFGDSRETETILGPAIQAGLEALKASDCAGKLFVFHSSLPIADAPGKLKNRDDRKVLGTDKEKTVLSPQNQFYNQLGQDCVTAGCCVDIFTFPNSFIDIATISQVCRLTGGQLYKYSYFQSDIDGDRLLEDLKHNLERTIGFDAIMRVRTSTGVRATDFFGNFFMSNTTDVELASIDSDKAIAVEIKHDDKLTEEDGVYIQATTLYTTCGGQRRLRIHNLSLNCCTQMADLFRSCELDTIMNFFAKQSMRVILDQSPKAVKDNYIQRAATILSCYRKNCASPSSAGQLILPEGMKLLPLYTNCLIKSDALAGGSDLTVDDRSFTMQFVNYMDVNSTLVYFYPRLFPLHNLDPSGTGLPTPLRCTSDKLQDNGLYLLENGVYLFVWIGLGADPNLLQDVFGVASASQIDADRLKQLPVLDNSLSNRIRDVIEIVMCERQRSLKMQIIKQRDKLDIVFHNFLVEDKSMNGGSSYVDFLCHMHKEIRSLLS